MRARAKVVELTSEAVIAEVVDAQKGERTNIHLPYSEAFLGGRLSEAQQAYARCGNEFIRVGEVIDLVQQEGNKWSRRAVLEERRSAMKPGAVVYAKVASFRADSLVLATEQGLPAKCSLALLKKCLEEKGIPTTTDSQDMYLSGRIRIGDPVAGYVREAGKGDAIELDVAGYLEKVEEPSVLDHRLRHADLLKHAPAAEMPVQTELPEMVEVPCPPRLGKVMIIDDDEVWIQEVTKWLNSSQAEPIVLPNDRWDSALEEAKQVEPDIILVDVFLEAKNRPKCWGWQIAATLQEGDMPWRVLLVTENPDSPDIAGRDVPPGVSGPIAKESSKRALVDGLLRLSGDADIPPPMPVVRQEADSNSDTERNADARIQNLVQAAEDRLNARVAVFSYDFFQDRAFFRFGDEAIRQAFRGYLGSQMHKSQIRDLAFHGGEAANVSYPKHSLRERSWHWLRRLVQPKFSHSVGLRLATPDRDEVWSLFAFFEKEPPGFGDRPERLIRAPAAAIEDVRWRKHLEQEAEQNREIIDRARRSQDLAHEVKSDVRAIRRRVYAVLDDIQAAASDEAYIGRILKECIHRCVALDGLADSLLRLAPGPPGEHSLREILSECTLRYVDSEGKIDVLAPAVEPTNLHVTGQRELIFALVDNLLRNAIEAVQCSKTYRGTGASGARGQICIEAFPCEEDETRAEILIHDTGCGISRHTHAQMWNRGFSTSKEGTGLGMGICARAAELLGGSVEVKETALYAGTTFRVVLPAAQQSDKEEPRRDK